MPILGAAIVDVIVAAIMMAVGIITIFFMSELKLSDTKAIAALVISVILVVAGAWLFVMSIGIFVILQKIAGLILLGFGVFMILGFPGAVNEYQTMGMAKTGIFIGIVLIIVGAYLLFF